MAARTDPALAEVRDRTDREMYEGFLRLVGALHDAGLLAPDTSVEVEAARLHALVDGLAAHGVNHPRRMDAERLHAVLDAHFAALLVDGDTV